MANKERRSIVDAQWQRLQPGWGPKDNEGERKMLYDILGPGEDVELLHSCGFDTKNVAWGSRHDRGVVAATGRRVILLNRGRLSKNRFGMIYLEIDEITEPGPGKVRLRGREGAVFDLDLQSGAAEFSRFVRDRLLSDGESIAAAFSHVLEPGEQVRHWARCSAGPETVSHIPGSGGGPSSARTPASWLTFWLGNPTLAVATERRILLITLAVDTDLLIDVRKEELIANSPHGTIPAVEHTGGQRVRFVDQRGQVYAADFQREADASPFVNLMREHMAAAGQRVSKERRTSAQWKLQHPIWHYRNSHKNERSRLGEILDVDEHLEALLWGRYSPKKEGASGHSGVIAATSRRLLLVSNSWDDKHVSQLPLHGISGVTRYDDAIDIEATPGFAGYRINELDDMSRHHSEEKGQGAEFIRRLRLLIDEAQSKPSAGSP